MTTKSITLGVISASLLLGFVGWRLQVAPSSAVDATILLDRSKSVQDPCTMLRGLTEQVVQRSAGLRGSRLTIFATGDATTSYQPSVVFSQLVPTRQRLLKDRQRVIKENGAFVGDVQRACAGLRSTLSSPIFLDIQNVVSHQRASDGPTTVQRQLFVLSDLRETYEPLLRRALQQPQGTKAKLPPPIENTDINVVVCGFAQSRALPPLNTDRVIEIWRQLFSEPGQLKFDPFCSQLAPQEVP